MAQAEGGRLGKNHIRQIRHYYLSSGARSRSEPLKADGGGESLHVYVTGTPGSAWPLPFAINLALAAASTGGGTRLTVPAQLFAASARLLGGAGRQLLEDAGDDGRIIRPKRQGGLDLVADPDSSSRALTSDWKYHFELHPKSPGPAPWLYLCDEETPAPFSDPRGGLAAPLFVVGLDRPPPPMRSVSGVWGAVGCAALLTGDAAPRAGFGAADLRQRALFAGYLESLSRIGLQRGGIIAGGGANP